MPVQGSWAISTLQLTRRLTLAGFLFNLGLAAKDRTGMAERTNAAAMALSVGVEVRKFRDALRAADFPWYTSDNDWTVEIDSPEHEAMRTVLLVMVLKRERKPRPPAAR